MNFIFNETISPEDIKNIRKSLNLTKRDLAKFLNIYEKTLANWESGKKPIKSSSVTLLRLLKDNHDLIDKYIEEEPKTTLRIKYMHNNDICTIIDVDYPNNKIYVKNYVDNPFYKAFGNNNNPSINDLENLLESRCVEKNRADIKQYLKKLDIPFYDPLMIVEKTGGKTTEDDFWLKVERNEND